MIIPSIHNKNPESIKKRSSGIQSKKNNILISGLNESGNDMAAAGPCDSTILLILKYNLSTSFDGRRIESLSDPAVLTLTHHLMSHDFTLSRTPKLRHHQCPIVAQISSAIYNILGNHRSHVESPSEDWYVVMALLNNRIAAVKLGFPPRPPISYTFFSHTKGDFKVRWRFSFLKGNWYTRKADLVKTISPFTPRFATQSQTSSQKTYQKSIYPLEA